MNFWQVNRNKIVFISIFEVLVFLVFATSVPHISDTETFLYVAVVSVFLYVLIWLVVFLPVINSFRVIRRIAEDTSERSVVPLFDAGYSIGLQNKGSIILLATPCINALISGLPVVIGYTPRIGQSEAGVTFKFYPLTKEGGSIIYSRSISFAFYFQLRLRKEVKGEVLQYVEKIIESGLVCGEERVGAHSVGVID